MFQKGDSRINRKGRPPGKKNIIQTNLKENIEQFVSEKFPKLWKDFDTLETNQKFAILEKYTSYVLPKPKEVDMYLQVEKLSEQQLEQLADYILNENSIN